MLLGTSVEQEAFEGIFWRLSLNLCQIRHMTKEPERKSNSLTASLMLALAVQLARAVSAQEGHVVQHLSAMPQRVDLLHLMLDLLGALPPIQQQTGAARAGQLSSSQPSSAQPQPSLHAASAHNSSSSSQASSAQPLPSLHAASAHNSSGSSQASSAQPQPSSHAASAPNSSSSSQARSAQPPSATCLAAAHDINVSHALMADDITTAAHAIAAHSTSPSHTLMANGLSAPQQAARQCGAECPESPSPSQQNTDTDIAPGSSGMSASEQHFPASSVQAGDSTAQSLRHAHAAQTRSSPSSGITTQAGLASPPSVSAAGVGQSLPAGNSEASDIETNGHASSKMQPSLQARLDDAAGNGNAQISCSQEADNAHSEAVLGNSGQEHGSSIPEQPDALRNRSTIAGAACRHLQQAPYPGYRSDIVAGQ